jgi:thioredoxin 1
MGDETVLTLSGLDSVQARIMEAKGNFLLDFWGPSCAPCIDLNRGLEELEASYDDRVTFVKINADDDIDVAAHFGVRGLPTLILIHDGQIKQRWIGVMTAAALKARLDKALLDIPTK